MAQIEKSTEPSLTINLEEKFMKLSAPTQAVFWLAVIIALLALTGSFVTIPYLTAYGFWILLVGFIVLMAGNMMKGV